MTTRSSPPKPKAYEVVDATATRRSLDPASPRYREWVRFAPGDVVTDWPRHAPVAEWVASGHWKESEA